MGYEDYTIMVYLLQEEVFDMFRLKILREQRHLSQVFLGMELGMSQNTISRYETGAREADYDTLIAFADYFQVSIDYLLGRTENPEINR
jgi:transcriptional regulator with XRE-family HTH domain